MPLLLCRCWLGGRKGIRPVKTDWWGAGMVICLEQDADLHMAQLMPLPLTVSCLSKILIGFTFLALAHPGSPGKRAVKCVWCSSSRFLCLCCLTVHYMGQKHYVHLCICMCLHPYMWPGGGILSWLSVDFWLSFVPVGLPTSCKKVN